MKGEKYYLLKRAVIFTLIVVLFTVLKTEARPA